jgi:hypothetical protein
VIAAEVIAAEEPAAVAEVTEHTAP